MSSRRVLYQDWIVELGFDPSGISGSNPPPITDKASRSAEELARLWIDALSPLKERGAFETRQDRIIEAVRSALSKIEIEEREFILLHHYMGRSYREISELSGRAIYKLEALHNRGLRQLKRELAGFVKLEFGIVLAKNQECLICASADRNLIDSILTTKKREETWSRFITLLEHDFQIKIRTPQTIIGHCKFH